MVSMTPSMKLDRFQRWAVATTIATYFLIAIGGLVRASGSGLGCPDWPKCFDRWIPPLSVADVPAHIDPSLFNFAKAWTEYLNRLAGVTVGILIFVTLVLAVRHHRRTPRILWPTVMAFVLVGFEGWLGGQVVASRLRPWVLSVHLTFALIIAMLLVYATVFAFVANGRVVQSVAPERKLFRRLAVGALALGFIQIASGAVLRGELQEIAKRSDIARDAWLTAASTPDLFHRNFAVITVSWVIVMAYVIVRRATDDRSLVRASIAAAILAVAQVLAGIGLVRFAVPQALQVAHLWLGSLLLGAVMIVAVLALRERLPKR